MENRRSFNGPKKNFGPSSRGGSGFGQRNQSRFGQDRPFSSFKRSSSSGFGGGRRKKRFADQIDISKFINKAVPQEQVEEYKVTNSFTSFKLTKQLEQNILAKGYTSPTPIQDQSILSIMEGRDLVGLANTGTGKTGAFLIPLINKVATLQNQRVIIVAPTRELALQIDEEFRSLAQNMRIYSTACIGGAPMFKQIRQLKRGPQFIIGTPGRLKDLVERSLIRLEQFNNIVLDEVDRMLDMGFVDEIRELLSKLPKERQSLFFSATMPPKIKDLVVTFLNNPVYVSVKTGDTAQTIDQDVVRIRDRSEKLGKLKELLAGEDFKKVLIFSEKKIDTENLTEQLNFHGFRAKSIHGDKKQRDRQRALAMFRTDEVNILVATDVAARGLDIKDVSHVINYDIPQTYDDYVHRIGRTGRGGQVGKALTFVSSH